MLAAEVVDDLGEATHATTGVQDQLAREFFEWEVQIGLESSAAGFAADGAP